MNNEPVYIGVAVTGCASEADDPTPVVVINPTLTLTAKMSPPEVVTALSKFYGNDWIMQLFDNYLNRRREMIE